jgi:hypothetical protein
VRDSPHLYHLRPLDQLLLNCPHRFTFTAPSPGVYHETWACFTHPPLEPPADRSRRRGAPLPLHLQGTVVPDGDSPGPVMVAAGQLKARVEQKTRDTQVCLRSQRVAGNTP